MTQRFQFSLRALLILLLAVACFFGGIRFERERRRRADEAVRKSTIPPGGQVFKRGKIEETYDKFDAPRAHFE